MQVLGRGWLSLGGEWPIKMMEKVREGREQRMEGEDQYRQTNVPLNSPALDVSFYYQYDRVSLFDKFFYVFSHFGIFMLTIFW